MEPLRVLIADDHPLFRHGIHEFLNLVPDIQVVGEATSGEEALAQAEALQPDVILMDVNMPGVNGIEATRRILHNSPHIRVLEVTMFEDDSTVFAAMRVGARGYILKDAEKENILRAIHAVANGEAIFSPTIATRLIDFFASQGSTLPKEIFPP
jgi:DNA-binding NarL/FixJ family response regulator